MRGATPSNLYKTYTFKFQSTLPMRGATMMLYINDGDAVFQSTLPMRGATTTRCSTTGIRIFQSTLPMRGATLLKEVGVNVADFNPRSPCGERPGRARMTADRRVISIHAPHAGSDFRVLMMSALLTRFQSTLPMRGATRRRLFW